ncbi:MAG: type II CAAX prenyl endopeptidase Rce1 family protein [Caulobacter sp.]
MTATAPRQDRTILVYLLLVFGLSLPFWLAGAFADRFLPASMPIRLPPSALMAFVPVIAALILTARQGGAAGVRALLARAVDGARVRPAGWWLAAVLLMPAAMLLEYGLVLLRDGPISHPVLPLARLPVFFLMFLAAGLGEELGWQGFLYERLTPRLSALAAALALGAIWVVWHIIPMSQTGHAAAWSTWQLAAMIPLRIITVWLFAAGGRSVLLVAVFHAMTNVSEFMFPNYGSHYDPFLTCVILAVVAVAAVVGWGPATLAGRRR